MLSERRRRLRYVEFAWSWARLLTFLGFFGAWFWFVNRAEIALPLMAGCVVLFMVSMRRHLRVRDERVLADHQVGMIDESLKRVGGRVEMLRSFRRAPRPEDPAAELHAAVDDGPVLELTDQERDDLDLFTPPIGLFGLLNRTSTTLGWRRLDAMVNRMMLSAKHIAARQSAVRWLDEHPGDRLRLMGALAGLRDRDRFLEQLIVAIRGARALPWPGWVAGLRLWSIPSGLLAAYALMQSFRSGYEWMMAFFGLTLLNGFLYLRVRGVLNESLANWRYATPAAEGLLRVARQASEHLPAETPLAEVRAKLEAVLPKAALGGLARAMAWNDTGGVGRTLMNLIVFYDVHLARAILRRAVTHREALLDGLSAMAEVEALCSLASFAWESRGGGPVCWPELVDETRLRIDHGRHPLIDPPAAVSNSLEMTLERRMWIITGSNMAGKSTFLRMTGVSVLLAQLGTAVLAERMAWRPLRLITDLRARDNLAREESYFLAEVRQLRRMLESVREPSPMLGLIDEPFRGTNSDERQAASLAVAQHLLGADGFFLIATHERLMTVLADGVAVRNFHFREQVEQQGMVFDYVLREGPAQTRNALRVLEREDYPAELLEVARKWLRRIHEEEGARG